MRKKKNIILIMLLICILGIIAITFVVNNLKVEHSIDGRTAENQLLLNGFGVFSEKYTGTLKTSEIMEKLSELVKNDIPELYSNIKKYNDSELENYYQEHSANIKNTFGKNSLDEFKNFAKKLQQVSVNLDKWYTVNVNKESFIEKSDITGYSYVEFTVKFEDETELKYLINVPNNQNMPYIIDILN